MKREQAAFVCSHVFDMTRPILLVAHEGGDWQFLCGDVHRPGEKPRVVGLEHLTERDEQLSEVLDLPEGWEAERTGPAQPWVRRPIA